MESHPDRKKNHNEDTNGGLYHSKFSVIALAQTDRLRLRAILHLSKKLVGQSGKATHADHPSQRDTANSSPES
jgi:hypothetical protein